MTPFFERPRRGQIRTRGNVLWNFLALLFSVLDKTMRKTDKRENITYYIIEFSSDKIILIFGLKI